MELWSKRTAQIEADASPKIAEYESTLGRPLTATERVAVVKTAVLKTRPGKNHPDASALHEGWTSEAAAAGFSGERVLAAVRAESTQRPEPAESAVELLAEAVRAAGRVRAVFSRADVAGQVAARLPTADRTAIETVAHVEELTDAALAVAEAVSVGEHPKGPKGLTSRASDGRWASAEVLAAEARVLSLAERGRRGGYGRVPDLILIPTLIASSLDASQYEAARHLAGSGDFLSVLTAPAGAGKTHTLGAATAGWQAAGFRVIGLAPLRPRRGRTRVRNRRTRGHPGQVAAQPDPPTDPAPGGTRVGDTG